MEHWQQAVDCTPPDPDAWQAQWFMPHAEILLAPPVAGFVGSDLLADLIATGLAAGPPGSLLLDFGTNTEIALWDGRRVHVTSVPGGPAFEGVGIRHGMAAEPGAIHRVREAAGAPVFETIGEAPPRGYCGSGFVDAVAMLAARGALKANGRFVDLIESGLEFCRTSTAQEKSRVAAGRRARLGKERRFAPSV